MKRTKEQQIDFEIEHNSSWEASPLPKHTHGEWHAHDGQIYPLETGKTLALIPYYEKGNKEQEANAKLISAAPDMLNALKRVNDLLDQEFQTKDALVPAPICEAYEIIMDAIQKATA